MEKIMIQEIEKEEAYENINLMQSVKKYLSI